MKKKKKEKENSKQKHDSYIWVMKEYGVPQSWTKLFVIPFDTVTYFLGCSENGLLLVQKSTDVVSANGESEWTEHKFVSIGLNRGILC